MVRSPVLCFAYRLLAQLYAELGQPEQAAAYSRRCKEVEIDVSLQALVGAAGDAEEGLAEPAAGAQKRKEVAQKMLFYK